MDITNLFSPDLQTLTLEQRNTAMIVYGSILGFAIILLIIFAIIASLAIADAKKTNSRIALMLLGTPEPNIHVVNAAFQATRKKLGVALLLALGFGSFGFHHLYMGKRTAAVLSILFFWTGIPGIIALFNALNMPKTVSHYNLALVEILIQESQARESDDDDNYLPVE